MCHSTATAGPAPHTNNRIVMGVAARSTRLRPRAAATASGTGSSSWGSVGGGAAVGGGGCVRGLT